MALISSYIKILPEKLQIKLINMYLDRKFSKGIKLSVKNSGILDKIEEPVIFICNHLSNFDGIVLSRVLRKFNPSFVAGIKLSENKDTNIFLKLIDTIPIKPNSADIESMKKIISKIKEGKSVMLFPEGTRSRTGSMIEAKKGILLIAKMTKATIVPISLMGTEKVLPVNKEGHMEEEKLHNGNIEIIFGQPFKVLEKEKNMSKEDYEKIALLDIMRRISENLREEYKGVYKK